jgi:hypothetical protein
MAVALAGAAFAVLGGGDGDDADRGSETAEETTSVPTRAAGPLEARPGMAIVDPDLDVLGAPGELPREEPTEEAWAVDRCVVDPCIDSVEVFGDVVVGLPPIGGTDDGTVVGFDLASGEQLWTRPGVGAAPIDTPDGPGILVLRARTDGSGDPYGFGVDAMRVDPRSGDDLWAATADVEQLDVRSVSDAVFTSRDGVERGGGDTMTGISVETGEVVWSIDGWVGPTSSSSPDDIRWNTSPSCGGYTFKASSSDITAYDLETGEAAWTADVAIPQDLVSASCTDDTVWFSGGWSGTARDNGEENGSSPLIEVDLGSGEVGSERVIDDDLFAVVDGRFWAASPFTPDATDLVVLDDDLEEASRTEGVFSSFSGIDALDDEVAYLSVTQPVSVDRGDGALRHRCDCAIGTDLTRRNTWAANALVQTESGKVTAYRLPDFVESWSIELAPTDNGDPPGFAAADQTLVVIDGDQVRALRAPT